MRDAFRRERAHFCTPEEKRALERLMIPPSGKGINPDIVGQQPQTIARRAGFTIAPDAKLMIVELSKEDTERLEKAFVNQEDAAWGAKPRGDAASVPADWIDPQLARAIDVALGKVVVQEMPGNVPKKG